MGAHIGILGGSTFTTALHVLLIIARAVLILLVLNVVHTGVSFPGHSCCMGSIIASHIWLDYMLLHLHVTSVHSISCTKTLVYPHVRVLQRVADRLVGDISHLPETCTCMGNTGTVKSGWKSMAAFRLCYILLLQMMSLLLHDCCQRQVADVCCKGNRDKLYRFQSGDCLLGDSFIWSCLTWLLLLDFAQLMMLTGGQSHFLGHLLCMGLACSFCHMGALSARWGVYFARQTYLVWLNWLGSHDTGLLGRQPVGHTCFLQVCQ
jgi:hypothetical protein